MSLQEITERELSLYGVVSLPTRPGASREFGGRSYTPTELKEAFDRLPRLLAERYNELVRQVSEGDLAETLTVTRDGEPVSLQAYLKDITERLLEEEQKSSGLTQTDASYGALIEELQKAVDEIDTILEKVDDTPTEGSTNPVTSGGVYHQLQGVQTDLASFDTRVTGLEHDQVEVEAFVISMRADVDTLLSIAKDTVVAVDTVEDTYSTRETAGGLDIIDGTRTEVRKIQGTTRVVDGTLVNSVCRGIVSQSADGSTKNKLILSSQTELGAFDYIDVEKHQVVRQTYYIDCATTPFDIGCSYSDGYKAYTFWLAFLTAPKVYQGAYKATDIVPNHYEVGGFTKDKRVIFGRTAQNLLCITIRDDEFVRYNDDGSFSQAESSKALKAHLVEIGFQFACKPSEPLSVTPISCPTFYVAYEGGTESILPEGETVTITQDYYTKVGGGEA